MKLATLVLTTLLCTQMYGCKRADDGREHDEGLMSRLGQTYDDAKRTISDLTPDSGKVTATAQKEFENLFILEYKVVEVDNGASAQKLQEVLVQLGRDRWECSQILERGASYMIPCRRRPTSLLRYALKFLPWP